MARIPLPDLPDWLAAEISGAATSVAVLAGHFAIFSAGAAASDLLDDPSSAPAGAAEMIAFTRFTWQLACEVGSRPGMRPFQLVPLVDDIQFIRPVLSDRPAAERLAAALAAGYLERVPRLPDYHHQELAGHGLHSDAVLRHADESWLFSERSLRIAAVRRLRGQLATAGPERTGITETAGGGTLTVDLPGQGECALVQAGHAGCAGGYLELLATLHDRGVRRLFALVPMRCLAPVALGTTLAHRVFGMPEFAAITIGIPDRQTTGFATVLTE